MVGVFLDFDRFAIRPFFGVAEFDIAIIDFRGLIDQIEDSGRTSECHRDRIDLLRHLANRLGELLRKR
jgi:hypothetical protein